MERTMAFVQTEISLHQLINGLEELVEVYPVDRLDKYDVMRIQKVAEILENRINKGEV
jgi:hypothetical protein